MRENSSSDYDKRWCSIKHCPFKPWDGLSFHRFPFNNAELREKWRAACGIEKVISPFMHICSNHFKHEEYFPRRVGQRTRILKPGSVPSQHLPCTPQDSALLPSQVENVNQYKQTRRSGRISRMPKKIAEDYNVRADSKRKHSKIYYDNKKTTDKRMCVEMSESGNQTEDATQTCDEATDITPKPEHNTNATVKRACKEVKPLDFVCGQEKCEHGEFVVDEVSEFPGPEDSYDRKTLASMVLKELQSIPLSREEKIICSDVVAQVCKMPNETRSLLYFLQSTLELRAFTGIRHDLLESMAEAVSPYEDGRRKQQKSLKERIVMTLCKMRLNLSFLCLGYLFSLNRQTCRLVFLETIEVLKTVLSGAVYWPTKESVLKTMPTCFNKFRHTRVVIDSIDVVVEKLKCLQCGLCLYSDGKKCEIVKIVTGVAPSGLFTFISKPYGGQTSNEMILKQSNFLDMLLQGEDSIMVGEGFDIENECAEKGLSLIRPPSLSNKKLLSAEEALASMNIAAARVHVAEALQRMKKFKILSSVLPNSLLPYASSIFTVIAAAVNLSSSVLSDDTV